MPGSESEALERMREVYKRMGPLRNRTPKRDKSLDAQRHSNFDEVLGKNKLTSDSAKMTQSFCMHAC